MSSDRPIVASLPGPLVPLALTARRILPDEPIDSVPLVRIARYAVLALVVYAVGLLVAGAVSGAVDLFSGPMSAVFGPGWSWFVDVVRETIETFALLVAAGVFLTQFETAD